MAKRHVGDQRLLPDSKANPAIESLCRAVARADAEAKLSKLAADDARDRLAAELKKLPVPAYLRSREQIIQLLQRLS